MKIRKSIFELTPGAVDQFTWLLSQTLRAGALNIRTGLPVR